MVDFLCQLDAQLTAEAGNAACESLESEGVALDVAAKAKEAAQVRFIIDKLIAMRDPDFKWQYLEPQKKTTTIQPDEE